MKRTQEQFNSDDDRDKKVYRALLCAARDMAIIILIGIVSVAGMIWIAMDGRLNNW